MRQMASTLNRGWLAVLGLLLLVVGVLTIGLATGTARQVLDRSGVSVPTPDPGSPLVGGGWDAAWVPAVVVAGGLVIGLLGLAWLIAQVPRTNQAKPLRLHDTADSGLTWAEPTVLTDAVEAHTASLAGVDSASAVLRGNAARPELTIKVTASDRADVAGLVEQVSTTVAQGLGTALDTRVARLGVLVEISRPGSATSTISV